MFVQGNRFDIIERSNWDLIDAERLFQRSEEFMDDDATRAEVQSIGSEYLVIGNVPNISADKKTTDQGTVYYEAVINFGLKVVSVGTGRVEYSESFSNTGGRFGALTKMADVFSDDSTPSAAVTTAISKVKGKVGDFVNKAFPFTVDVLGIETRDKKDRAVEILISGGESIGIKEKVSLIVYEEVSMTVGDAVRIREKVIGEIKVIRVEGDDFSLCKVTKGKEEIAERVDAGVELKAKLKL